MFFTTFRRKSEDREAGQGIQCEHDAAPVCNEQYAWINSPKVGKNQLANGIEDLEPIP